MNTRKKKMKRKVWRLTQDHHEDDRNHITDHGKDAYHLDADGIADLLEVLKDGCSHNCFRKGVDTASRFGSRKRYYYNVKQLLSLNSC